MTAGFSLVVDLELFPVIIMDLLPHQTPMLTGEVVALGVCWNLVFLLLGYLTLIIQ